MKITMVLAAVLGLGLLVGVCYAGYWYGTQQTQTPQPNADRRLDETPTPTTNPVANWKTYKSQVMMFSVKYPPDWLVSPEESVPPADIYELVQMGFDSPKIKAGQLFLQGAPMSMFCLAV